MGRIQNNIFFSTVKKSTWFQGMLTNQVYRLSLWLCFLLTWGFIEFIVCLELDSRLMCPPSSRLVSVVALSAGVLFLPSALRKRSFEQMRYRNVTITDRPVFLWHVATAWVDVFFPIPHALLCAEILQSYNIWMDIKGESFTRADERSISLVVLTRNTYGSTETAVFWLACPL